MKKSIGFSVLMVTSLCFLIFCGDKSTNGPNHFTGLTIVGDWEEVFHATPPLIPFDLTINLSIAEQDSTFKLNLVENAQENSDTLYMHSGTWRIGKSGSRGGDSLYLFGKECYLIDTTADPDTMKQLSDSEAEQTITLDTTRTENDEWIINLGNLKTLMTSMLPSEAIEFVSTIDFLFERKTRVFIR